MFTETTPAAQAADITARLATELLGNDCVATRAAIALARDLRTPAKSLPGGAATAAATIGIQVRFASVGDRLSRSNVCHETSIVRNLAR